MEDRYEIKGKLGQGGIGAVYRAFDVRMNREVAIKRIVANSDDLTLSEEATRQLIKEAGALATLQHPNIVTVYDVGTDEDGPFIIMELLTGSTLDELVEKAPLTWQDFRELALQTQEALIAAQELHLVHRDLKPGNIMLTWLPSGKFQVKIVDFGLAKLSAAPSLQTIDQSDGVFGSIYFMAPEQFERIPLDLRADMYAIGCVYYFALTGTYPFDGDNAAEVMASHLQHHVTPLQEDREGIPLWACDWIMWHLNRKAADRPESARRSLKIFVENSSEPSPPMSTGNPSPTQEQPKRPRLLIPGAAPVPEVLPDSAPAAQPKKTTAAPKPLTPPQGSKASVHTTAQVVLHSPTDEENPQEETQSEAAPAAQSVSKSATQPVTQAAAATKSAPMLIRPTGELTGPAPTAKPVPVAKASATGKQPVAIAPSVTTSPQPKKKKAGLSSGAKTTIAAVLGIVAVLLAVLMLKKTGQNRETEIFNEMMKIAGRGDATELPVDKLRLDILLRNAAGVGSNTERNTIYKALFLAKATDGIDVDATIAEFATTRPLVPDIRHVIIRDVLRKRNNPAIIDTLLAYARSADDPKMKVAAIEATRFMAGDDHFTTFIEIIQTSDKDEVRAAAEGNAAQIISKSSNTSALGDIVASAHDAAFNEPVRHTMLRLMGRIGGDKALELVRTNLESPQDSNKIAAITALGSWSDESGFPLLMEFISTTQDLELRNRAFDAAIKFLGERESASEENWGLLHAEAKTQDDQLKVVRGLVNVPPQPWVLTLVQKFVDESEYDRVIDLAHRGIDRLRDIQKLQNPKEDESEDDQEEAEEEE